MSLLHNHSLGFHGDWHHFRQTFFSQPLFKFFRKALPRMSKTEQDALQAGTVWWDGELFSGKPDWNQLYKMPLRELSAEEQAYIDGPVNELCEMVDDWQITQSNKDLPVQVWDFIKKNRLFGLIIPKKYGGLDFSALAHSTIVMKIASKSISAAVTIMVPNSLGPAKLLLEYGTQEQKDYYLPRLAKGEEIPAFALTSPTAGSDAGSMTDSGVVCWKKFEGKRTLGIRLNWEKRYITLGPICSLLGLAFKLYDPDHLIGEQTELGITLALIPAKTKGITIGRRHNPLNQTFQNGPNSGRDVFIPMDWLIGGQENVGKGWTMLMESLADGRSISLPALSTGSTKLASRAVGAYAHIRKQFNTPIGNFGGVSEALTRIAANTYMLDATRRLTLSSIDAGEKPSVVSAMVKYHMTEKMRAVVNDAMDVYGGAAICMGPRNIMGRVYQAVPISITVEGANILTRCMIIFGQGVIRSHPFVYKEIDSVNTANYQQALRKFDKVFNAHLWHIFKTSLTAIALSLSDGYFSQVPGQLSKQDISRRYFQKLNRFSSAFALLCDYCLMTLGGKLKRMESLSGRFADILSYMYMASAVLKRYQHDNYPVQDKVLVQWCCEQLLFQTQVAFTGILDNLPNQYLAKPLKWLLFPFAGAFQQPNDELSRAVAKILLSPSTARNKLTEGIYLSSDSNTPIGRLDDALVKVIEAEKHERTISQLFKQGRLSAGDDISLINQAYAQGDIDSAVQKILLDANQARSDVIKVDDFSAKLT